MLRGIVGAGLMLLVLASDAPAQSGSPVPSAAGFSDVSAQRGLSKGGLVQYRYKTDEQLGFTRGGGLRTKKTETPARRQKVRVVPVRVVVIQHIYYQSARPNFNLACKRKYPAFVSWMERQWTRCRRAPSPAYGEEQLKAWQCWCRVA